MINCRPHPGLADLGLPDTKGRCDPLNVNDFLSELRDSGPKEMFCWSSGVERFGVNIRRSEVPLNAEPEK